MRRAFSDVLISILAVGFVLIVLIAFDGRIRAELTQRIARSHSPAELIDGGSRINGVASFAFKIVKTESRDHKTLMIFVIASTVLTLFMVRT
jgi:hypothetical protein